MSVPAAYLGIVIIWATTPLAIQWSGDDVGPMFGLTARMAVGTLLSLLLLWALRVRLPWDRASIRCYGAVTLALYGTMTCGYWAAQYVPSGLLSVMFGLTPLVTGLLGMLWLNERAFTGGKLIGLLMALSGLAIIFRADLSAYPDAWLGICLLLFGVTLNGASMVLVKRNGATLHALAQSTGGLLLAFPCYVLTWFLLDGLALPETVPVRNVFAIGYLAVFGSVIGLLLFYYALKRVNTGSVALITLITPVLALFLGSWINHEAVSASVWMGAGVVLAGLALYQWPLRRRSIGPPVLGGRKSLINTDEAE
ncbi:hypothetical protein CAI21_20885 [Alkalilimnicola ehrlichii]|uniref:EamA domain-containing protein n=1 Tax=Alkalilimnicola ehrlichii TaxID=351052 RepID=A0A3E0WNG9_9GAMM|nr:DMT family transporter [Alkalilimnicola ehrlichii]RFA24670.1 hypothetical protein CAI21_20885 [Alkalilimnicola ehrlichii]RFA33753.1 hypothetical protein CAL65_16535 [Alkalilimnicola ehrlichii]